MSRFYILYMIKSYISIVQISIPGGDNIPEYEAEIERERKQMGSFRRNVMADKLYGFRENWKNRGTEDSGISKSFFYDTEEIRKRIEKLRKCEIDDEMNRHAKYDKTSRSKDVIIEAKDKRIAMLEEENRNLEAELSLLRRLLFEQK